MRERSIEVLVGVFMLVGILALLVLALKVSGLSNFAINDGYSVTANFDNIGDLKVHAPVTVAGVRVGEVSAIRLDSKNFRAQVTMQIEPQENKLPLDTSAAILTQGLLGSNYISLSPGFNAEFLKNGSRIENTHPALILEDLIGQLIFSLKNSDSK